MLAGHGYTSQRNRKQGRCGCGKKLADGKASCSKCLETSSLRKKHLRTVRKKRKLCIDCGAPAEMYQIRCFRCNCKRRKTSIAVSKTVDQVRLQGEKYKLAGLVPQTEILRSETGEEFYQWWSHKTS